MKKLSTLFLFAAAAGSVAGANPAASPTKGSKMTIGAAQSIQYSALASNLDIGLIAFGEYKLNPMLGVAVLVEGGATVFQSSASDPTRLFGTVAADATTKIKAATDAAVTAFGTAKGFQSRKFNIKFGVGASYSMPIGKSMGLKVIAGLGGKLNGNKAIAGTKDIAAELMTGSAAAHASGPTSPSVAFSREGAIKSGDVSVLSMFLMTSAVTAPANSSTTLSVNPGSIAIAKSLKGETSGMSFGIGADVMVMFDFLKLAKDALGLGVFAKLGFYYNLKTGALPTSFAAVALDNTKLVMQNLGITHATNNSGNNSMNALFTTDAKTLATAESASVTLINAQFGSSIAANVLASPSDAHITKIAGYTSFALSTITAAAPAIPNANLDDAAFANYIKYAAYKPIDLDVSFGVSAAYNI